MAFNTGQTGRTQIEFDSELSLASDTEISLIIFTNNTGEILIVDQIIGTGGAEAVYRFLFNSVDKVRYNTSPSNPTMDIKFKGLILDKNDSIEIKVKNCDEQNIADFYGTFILSRSS